MKLVFTFLFVLVFALASATSYAAVDGNVGFSISLYETVDNTPGGIETETPPPVLLPGYFPSGALILLEELDGTGPTNWSDVVLFFCNSPAPAYGFNGDFEEFYYAQLFSDIEGQPWDPAFVNSVLAQNPLYMLEASNPPTVYETQCGTFYIYSDGDEPQIPEASVLALAGTGVLPMLGFAWRRRRI